MSDYQKLSSDKEDKILEKVGKWWQYAADHPTWKEAKELHIKCFQYREGQQWTTAELAELKERGQPDTVNNRVAVTINKLMGDFVERKYTIGWRGRNALVDDSVAEMLSDIFKYIRTSNKLQFEETDMADDGFTCGFGAMEVFVEFDDLNQPEIKVRHEDALVVYPDPDWRRYDWNEDARFIARARWLDADDIAESWPEAKLNVEALAAWDSSSNDNALSTLVDTFRNEYYVDAKKKKIRVIDMEYKEPKREEIYLFDDPSGGLPLTLRADDPSAKEMLAQAKAQNIPVETVCRLKKQINRVVFIGGKILEFKETRQKYFSLVPYVMYRKKNGVPYSLIALGLSLQDAINKRESKAIHLMNTNQTVAERGAYSDKEKFQEEIHKPDGFVEVNDGALTNKRIIFRNNLEMATSQFSMHQQAANDFAQVVGVSPGSAIDTGELRGSAALGKKFTELGKPVARIFENLTRTRSILGTVLLNFTQLYMTPQKVMLITDDENKQKLFQMSSEQLARVKTAQYDTIVDDFIDSPSIQQEQLQMFMQLLPQILPFGPFWIKKLLGMSDLKGKKEIVEELDKQNGPPPVEPKLSVQANINELMPIERAFFYKRMGDEELANQVLALAPQTTTELKSTVDIAKTKIMAHTARGTAMLNAKSKEKDKDDDKDPR